MADLDTSLLRELGNPVPTSQSQRDILENELADVRRLYAAETDPEAKQRHAKNIIAIQRNLAGKLTELPPSSDEKVRGASFPAQSTDYVKMVEEGRLRDPAFGSPPTEQELNT